MALLPLLGQLSPHFMCLQECQLTNGQQHILRSDLLSLGYYLCQGKHGLVTLVRSGCSLAPIAAGEADHGHLMQRLALLVGDQRILIRHRHAHSGSASCRAQLSSALEAESCTQHCIDIGDFNERPVLSLDSDSAVVFPALSSGVASSD